MQKQYNLLLHNSQTNRIRYGNRLIKKKRCENKWRQKLNIPSRLTKSPPCKRTLAINKLESKKTTKVGQAWVSLVNFEDGQLSKHNLKTLYHKKTSRDHQPCILQHKQG